MTEGVELPSPFIERIVLNGWNRWIICQMVRTVLTIGAHFRENVLAALRKRMDWGKRVVPDERRPTQAGRGLGSRDVMRGTLW